MKEAMMVLTELEEARAKTSDIDSAVYSEAFSEGRNAFSNGLKCSACHYPKGSDSALEWESGYQQAGFDQNRALGVPHREQ